MRFSLTLIALLLLFPISASATAPIDDAGAQRLKSSFQNIITYIDTVYGANGLGGPEPLMKFEGELTVVPQNTYYSVTWPHMYYQEPSGGKIDLGVIAFNAMPTDKPGYWKMSMALPAAYSFAGPDGTQVKINIGAQNAVGLFKEDLGWFIKLDANYENITIDGAEDALKTFRIGSVKISSDFAEDPEGSLTGPAKVAFKDLLIEPQDEDISIKFGDLGFDYSIRKLKPPSLIAYQEKIVKHAETLKALRRSEDDAASVPDDVDGKAVMDMLFDLYSFDLDGFDFRYRAENMEIASNNPENPDFRNFSLTKGHFGFGVDGLKSERDGTLSMDARYEGLAFEPLDPDYGGAIPQDVYIGIRAEKIPVQIISSLAQNTITAISTEPQMAQMAGLGFAMKLPAILSQAGTQIVVEDNFIKGALYNASLNGKLTADINAVSSAVGKFKGLFEGLDALYALATKNAANPDLDDAQSFADLVKTLDMIKAFGKPATGPNGKPAYAYEIELTPQGQFLINGQSMGNAPEAAPMTPHDAPPTQEEPAAGEPPASEQPQ